MSPASKILKAMADTAADIARGEKLEMEAHEKVVGHCTDALEMWKDVKVQLDAFKNQVTNAWLADQLDHRIESFNVACGAGDFPAAHEHLRTAFRISETLDME